MWVIALITIVIISYTLDQHYQVKVSSLELNRYVSNEDYLKANVLEILDTVKIDDGFGRELLEITLKLEGKSGQFTDEILEVPIVVFGVETERYPIRVGDNILLNVVEVQGEYQFSFATYQRERGLLLLAGIFVFIIVLIGRFKGISALIALAFSIHVVLRLLIPAILTTESLILPSFLMSIYILVGSFIIIGGFTAKTLHASMGSVIGISLSSLLAVFFLSYLKMSGIVDEQSFYLLNIEGVQIDLRGILFTSITIGSLGAIMDVSMSLASALNELKDPDKKIKDYLVSAYHISADMIATMTNTLILAYVGASLVLLILMNVYGQPSFFIFNAEYFAFEIMMSLLGALGLVLTLPATAFIFIATQWFKTRVSS